MVKDKDRFILRVLDKVSFMTVTQGTILCGYHDESVFRKRINNLKRDGYTTSATHDNHKLFSLTRKGLSELEASHKPCEIKGFSTEHTKRVADVAVYLYIVAGRSINDMIFDREIKRDFGWLTHVPDIVFGQFCIEVELTPKSETRLYTNLKSNGRNFKKQFWIVPDRYKTMIKRIKTFGDENKELNIKVIPLSVIEQKIKAYDLKTNSPRPDRTRDTIPGPIGR